MPKRSKPPVVREPVQVYLTQSDRALLGRAATKAGLSRAEVLRRGLRRVSAEILSDQSPMLAFLDKMAATSTPPGTPDDLAARHDDHLADLYADRHTPKKRK